MAKLSLSVFCHMAALVSFIFNSANFLPFGNNLLASQIADAMLPSFLSSRLHYFKQPLSDDTVALSRAFAFVCLAIQIGPKLGVPKRAWAFQLVVVEVVITMFHAYMLLLSDNVGDWTCWVQTGIFHPLTLLVGMVAFATDSEGKKADTDRALRENLVPSG